MDARQLEYFLAIVEHGGFSKAAAALHVAQPSLSQAMATLEADLGVALFHRVGRGVVLSEAGAELLEPSRRVLRDLAAVRDTAAGLAGLHGGTVEVATMPSPGIEPLTTLIHRFAELHPSVTVSTQAAFTPDEVVSLVRSGACELGLLGSASPVNPSGLDVLHVEDQPFVVVAAPGGAIEDGVTIRPADLAGQKLIASRTGSLMRSIVDDITATAGGSDTQIVTVVDHRTSILPLALTGVGVAVLPSSWTRLARRCGAAVAPLEPTAQLHVTMVSLPAHLTPAARAFLSLTGSLAARRLRDTTSSG
ncbi:LysR family transcriptional regulator [Streptomyces himastatinicus ATCC 53653]|uniref:LysR family transcriptional regulator n=1 Tax=Streptomyces himastatinicus ATCC 53653 TaxID=457427 RepID=D9WNC0_9ACTN|nr:LysR family transcriptional regulator [Streptomyces himastatinicus]EFL23817.1 LysR family transcriptional regulator [Streptomyces himastatinicus ATCC 53653]